MRHSKLGRSGDHKRLGGAQIAGVLLVGSYASNGFAQTVSAAAQANNEPTTTTTSQGVEAEVDANAEAVAPSVEPTGTEPVAPDLSYAGLRAQAGYYDESSRDYLQPYFSRFKPRANQWEVTLFFGSLFPSAEHNLKVPVLPVDRYSKAMAQLGFRVGYFPLSFVGAELQTFMAGGSLRDAGYSAAMYGLSGHLVAQLPFWSVVPFATVGIGTLGAISEIMGHDRDPSFIWGLGVKAPLNKRLNARFDFQDNLSQKRDAKNGTQTHHPSIQLGISFVFEREAERMPRQDVDYDGLFDADDKCPTAGALTVDGCPVETDGDGDGIFDSVDQCPTQAGLAPDGCPNLDEDEDGILVPDDHCPMEAGEAPTGCPNPDKDGDGLINEQDKCPGEPETKNGYEDADGCPDEMPDEVKSFTGVIPGIQFKQGTAQIDAKSIPTLDGAAKILSDYQSIQLEVSGHTSSEGSEARNDQLSIERAEAVRQYFLGKGIAPERVVARGAGASEPVADNQTKEGRERNRRIEFRVLTQP